MTDPIDPINLIDDILGIDPAPPEPDDDTGEYAKDGTRNRVPGLDRDPALQRPSAKREFLRMKRREAAAETIGKMPAAGHEVVMILTGVFHGWDVLEALIELAHPRKVRHLRIATLGTNRTHTHQLVEMFDNGLIKRITMVVSEVFADKSRAESALLSQRLNSRGQTYAVTRNHAKLVLFDFDDGTRIAMHGSMNLRRCNAFEQAVIANDKGMHDFFASYIDDVARTGRRS